MLSSTIFIRIQTLKKVPTVSDSTQYMNVYTEGDIYESYSQCPVIKVYGLGQQGV